MVRIFFLGCCLWILFVSVPASAFINIESLRQNLKSGFYGSSGVTAEGASGNVRIFKTGLNSQNIYKAKDHEFLFLTNYKYGEASRVKNTNKGNIHVRYATRLEQNLYGEIFGQVEFNEFQSLLLRRLSGLGLRACLFDQDFVSLYLGSGLFYEDEKIDLDSDQNNWRGNFYFSYRHLISEILEAVVVFYYQPSTKVINDYRLRFNLGFEFKVSQSLKWVNSLQMSQDTRPPQGIEKEDLSFNVGLNYEY